jgi:hypothetical protein
MSHSMPDLAKGSRPLGFIGEFSRFEVESLALANARIAVSDRLDPLLGLEHASFSACSI